MEVGKVGGSLPLIAVAAMAAFELYLKLAGTKYMQSSHVAVGSYVSLH